MKKWMRNLAVGIVLSSIKNSKAGQTVLGKLKKHSLWIGRIGILLFTALGAAKYFYPQLPIDDGAEVLGIVFSWLAVELGFDFKQEQLLNVDPTKPVDINLGDFTVTLPTLDEMKRTIESDVSSKTGEIEIVDPNGKKE